MPRSRSTKKQAGTRLRSIKRVDGQLKRWENYSDIPLDEEEQFHASRDQILLDGDIHANSDGDDDEVFALKGMEEEEEDYVEMDVEEEDQVGEHPQKKKGRKSKSKKKALQSSESEESESEEEIWGRSKSAYYSSNAAQLDSDDEESNELEEQEARRLQSKQREDLRDEDFGLNDLLDIERQVATDQLSEPVPVVAPPSCKGKKFIIRHLEKNSPETLALARDWDDTAQNLTKIQEKLSKLRLEDPDTLGLGMMHLHYQALLTYATTLAFYLHLRASEKYAQHPALLKSHPILTRLLTLKQSLTTVEELDFAVSDSDNSDDDDTSMTWKEIMKDRERIRGSFDQADLDPDELDDLLKDTALISMPNTLKEEKPPKKKRKASSETARHALPVFDLVEPNFAISKPTPSYTPLDHEFADAYGEATALQHADAADKSAHKKSLRFHISKIESTSARRQGARNQAVGGDDDLPYRERRKEKEARLAKEVKTRGRGQGGEDLNDTEPEPRVKKPREELSEDEELNGLDGYYELVKNKSKQKKEKKKAEYDAIRSAKRAELDDILESTGPRSLTRAILANKGLTPRRSKGVRNPRVKKRERFEKAKKKIASQRAVYKGGLVGTGSYDGEKSGISKVIKSVRLG